MKKELERLKRANKEFEKANERLTRINRTLEQRAEQNTIDTYYICLIREYAREEAQKAVREILQKPIEMTIEQIEEAFGHKIKIVNSKKDIL